MIKSISAKNLKGLTFNYPVSAKTLIIGNNGAGKSSILNAMELAINGFVAGSGKKQNAEILQNFSSGASLIVGISQNGTVLNRQWKGRTDKHGKWSVSQTHLINTRKAGKDKFVAALVGIGNPTLFNVANFMGMSNQKKIDMIFDLFPPSGDVAEIDQQISDLKDKLSVVTQKIRAKENFVSESSAVKASLELPAGSLAQITDEIKDLRKRLSEAQDQLKTAETKQIEEYARIKAEAEEKERQQERETKARENSIGNTGMVDTTTTLPFMGDQNQPDTYEAEPPDFEHDDTFVGRPGPAGIPFSSSESNEGGRLSLWKTETVRESLQAILNIIEKTECGGCAAAIMTMKEMKKYK